MPLINASVSRKWDEMALASAAAAIHSVMLQLSDAAYCVRAGDNENGSQIRVSDHHELPLSYSKFYKK